jgi:hypothetical protein
MILSLEKRLHNKKHIGFKSEGERQISYFLDRNLIKYQYEPSVLLIADDQKARIWYPDFYLPQYKTYIEYYGLAQKEAYAKVIEFKNKTYSKTKLDVIPVYPWMFAGDWQRYLMSELKHSAYRQHKNLMGRPYWTGSTRHRIINSTVGYRKNSRHR